MNKETCMKEAEESILHTYNRFPVVFDHGEGVYLYDGRKRISGFCGGNRRAGIWVS